MLLGLCGRVLGGKRACILKRKYRCRLEGRPPPMGGVGPPGSPWRAWRGDPPSVERHAQQTLRRSGVDAGGVAPPPLHRGPGGATPPNGGGRRSKPGLPGLDGGPGGGVGWGGCRTGNPSRLSMEGLEGGVGWGGWRTAVAGAVPPGRPWRVWRGEWVVQRLRWLRVALRPGLRRRAWRFTSNREGSGRGWGAGGDLSGIAW